MMKTINLVCGFLVVGIASSAFGGVTGDLEMMSTPKGQPAQMMQATVFFEADNYRMDAQVPNKPQEKFTYILNGAKNLRYSIMHSRRAYVALPPDDKDQTQFFMKGASYNLASAKAEGYTVKPRGQQKVSGVLCSVYDLKGGPKHDLKQATVSFADKSLEGIMMKMDGVGKNGEKFLLTMANVRKETFPPSTFLPPPDYAAMQPPPVQNLDHTQLMQEVQRIQTLPPAERQAAMEAFQKKMQKQAEAMGAPARK